MVADLLLRVKGKELSIGGEDEVWDVACARWKPSKRMRTPP